MPELAWVCCPGGIVGDQALLRVLVVPRPDVGTVAGNGLEIWPPGELVDEEMLVAVHLHDRSSGDARVVPARARFTHHRDLWRKAFPGDTEVEPPEPEERMERRVAVQPNGQTAKDVDATFTTVASNSVISADPDKRDRELADLRMRVTAELRSRWTRPLAPPGAGPATDPPLPTGDRPGFLETYGYVREHPHLLRALGLVFEVLVPRDALVGRDLVSVRWPQAPPELPVIVSPLTWFGPGFRPGTPEGEPTLISRGMVALVPDDGPADPAASPWSVVTVDVEQAGARLSEAARALVPATGSPASGGSVSPPASVSLPALRTAGLQLLRHGRQRDFDRRARRADSRRSRASLDGERLVADELVLGYRIDIRPQGGEWLSLHQRRATYFFQDGDAQVALGDPVIEEGQLKAHAAADHGGTSFTADEIVARWDGWSLSVPRPASRRRRAVALGGRSTRFGWDFAVPRGSLPLLRFGGVYDVRARVVDLAGGALHLADPTADRSVIERVHYRRHEPVSAPSVLLPDGMSDSALGPGESVTHVVLRSDPHTGLDPAGFASAHPRYPATPTRVLEPPVVTVRLVEQHGMFEPVDTDREAADRRAVTLLRSAQPRGGLLRDPASGGVALFPRPQPGELRVPARSLAWGPWPDPSPRFLELRWDDPPPGTPAVDVDGERLVVRLPPGDQVTVEVSSFLAQGFLDQLALMGVDGLPALSADAAEVGRHPLVTPSSTITLVHAVRKPPAPNRRLTEQSREPGDTAVVLNPERSLLGIDPRVTSQVEVVARWQERIDEQPRRPVTLAFPPVLVDRGDTQLREGIRHELGDTRHRRIEYTVTAVSRFRQHFDHSFEDGDTGEENAEGDRASTEEEPFRASSPAQVVSFASSARPAPLNVLSVTPGLDWTDFRSAGLLERRRRGGVLLVELGRPWYQTGDGEVLGLVGWTAHTERPAGLMDGDGSLTPPENDPTDDRVVVAAPPNPALHPFLSEVARDPIWVTAEPARWLDIGHVAQPAGSGISRVRLPEAGGDTVQVHQVTPVFEEGRWVARLDLSGVAASSYRPFVRLSLVRFQPSSLRGLEISPVHRHDLVQLLPERRLTVRRTSEAGQMPLTGAPTVGDVFVTLTGIRPEGPTPNVVYIVLEALRNAPAGTPPTATDLSALAGAQSTLPAWHPVALMSRITDREARDVKLQIPAGVRGPLRVRVVERESVGLRPTDPPLAGEFAGTPRYVVFADVVAVPDAP